MLHITNDYSCHRLLTDAYSNQMIAIDKCDLIILWQFFFQWALYFVMLAIRYYFINFPKFAPWSKFARNGRESQRRLDVRQWGDKNFAKWTDHPNGPKSAFYGLFGEMELGGKCQAFEEWPLTVHQDLSTLCAPSATGSWANFAALANSSGWYPNVW